MSQRNRWGSLASRSKISDPLENTKPWSRMEPSAACLSMRSGAVGGGRRALGGFGQCTRSLLWSPPNRPVPPQSSGCAAPTEQSNNNPPAARLKPAPGRSVTLRYRSPPGALGLKYIMGLARTDWIWDILESVGILEDGWQAVGAGCGGVDTG